MEQKSDTTEHITKPDGKSSRITFYLLILHSKIRDLVLVSDKPNQYLRFTVKISPEIFSRSAASEQWYQNLTGNPLILKFYPPKLKMTLMSNICMELTFSSHCIMREIVKSLILKYIACQRRNSSLDSAMQKEVSFKN